MDECDSDDSLYLTVISETERIPATLERVAQFVRRQGIMNSDGLLLVARELLMNAVVHGNRSDSSKMAMIRVSQRGRGLFEVQVDDEGEGFDFESLMLGLPEDPQSLGSRGLVLVHELAEELTFLRGGSRVRAMVDPSGRRPHSERGRFGYAADENSTEASCTSLMAKSP